MKKIIPIILALCLVFAGCAGDSGKPQETTTTLSTTQTPTTTPEPTDLPTEPSTEPPTEPLTEPPVVYRHPITGEVLEEPMTNRPVAIVINNIQRAQPLHSISHADVLFEIVAEGTVTRMVGIYTDLERVQNIGSIRSSRTYFIDLARSFNAPLVHCGGSEFAYKEFQNSGWPHLDELYHSGYFYRNQDRINAGYPNEHTLFADGNRLMDGLTYRYDMTADPDAYYGFDFSEDVALDGESGVDISFKFFKGGKSTQMVYDPESGFYHGKQHWPNMDREIRDANYNEPVDFKNVFILNAVTTTDGYRMFAELSGEGTGYYACNGKIVPIKWSRNGYTAPFTYTLLDGTPLTVGVGRTYIGVIPDGSPIEYK